MEVLVAEDDAFIDGYEVTDQSLTETLAPSSLLGDITSADPVTPKAATVKRTARKRAKPQRKASESRRQADQEAAS